MTSYLIKWVVRILPLVYLSFITMQSRLFDPIIVDGLPRVGQMLEMGHLILFAVLYILIILSLMTFGKLTTGKELIALTVTLLCAFGDEIHQYYVPQRSASFIDLVKNMIGIMVAWYFVRFMNKRISYKNNKRR